MPLQGSATDQFSKLLLGLTAICIVGCGVNDDNRLPRASEAGRRACVEEVHANYPGQGRMLAMRQCLSTIDERLAQQERQRQEALRQAKTRALPSADSPSVRDRFIYCRLHQSEIQTAEQERQRAQSVWTVASREESEGSLPYETAREAYEDALAELERLVPETMRDGQPLIPDAIRRFMTCDFKEQGKD